MENVKAVVGSQQSWKRSRAALGFKERGRTTCWLFSAPIQPDLPLYNLPPAHQCHRALAHLLGQDLPHTCCLQVPNLGDGQVKALRQEG